jgi:hypothetical protein
VGRVEPAHRVSLPLLQGRPGWSAAPGSCCPAPYTCPVRPRLTHRAVRALGCTPHPPWRCLAHCLYHRLPADVSFFWEAPASSQLGPHVPWAVTANMAVRPTAARFRPGFPTTGEVERRTAPPCVPCLAPSPFLRPALCCEQAAARTWTSASSWARRWWLCLLRRHTTPGGLNAVPRC